MTIELPSTLGFIKESNFYLETNTQVFTSPINNSVQTAELGGARWRLDFTLRQMTREDAARWIAFITKMRGMSETFYGYDLNCPDNLGVGGGTPLVNGAGQTGTSLTIDGAPANTVRWLREGDFFEVSGELKRVVQDIDVDGSGEATLVFEPYLRDSPSENDPIDITSPRVKMRLSDDRQQSWPTNHNRIYREKILTAFESIP